MVLGHLAMAVIDRGPDGALRGDNVLALHPRLAWLAMLAPMPVFFAAAGWAHVTASAESSVARSRTLVGLGAVVVTAWSVAAMVELAIAGGGVVADGARVATQPLWFLAVYVPFGAGGRRIGHVASRPILAVGGCLAVLATFDVARFVLDAPGWIGWPGFVAAWAVPWLLGAWWRDHRDDRRERRIGTWLAVSGTAGAVTLVGWFGYFPSLIDAVDGERSNTSPPTLFTAVAAIVQVGVLMVVAGRLDEVAARRRSQLDRAGEAAVAVYAWHLTALASCAALLAAGLWTPTRFSSAWWLSRPLWFALVLGATAALVAATAAVRRQLARRSAPRTGPSPTMRRAGVALATIGAAVAGRWGPRTVAGAVTSVLGFVAGWWLLRGRASPTAAARRHPEPDR